MSDKPTLLKITLKGKDSELAPISADVLHEIGRIPMARLVFSAFIEGENFAQTCAPGTELGIEGQDGDTWVPLFSGIVSGQKFTAKNGSRRLTIEVRDKAQALTISPRTRFFEKKKDSELCAEIIKEYGLAADIAATPHKHEQLIQLRIPDWDFILHRLWANGLVAIVKAGKISGVKPEPKGSPISLTADDIFELENRVEARAVSSAIAVNGWDPAKQQAVIAKGKAASVLIPGAFTAKKAEDVLKDKPELPFGGGAVKEELESWASGLLTHGHLALNQGRVCVAGRKAEPGDKLSLKECGITADGDGLIWGVRHTFNDGVWITELQFGTAPLAAAAELWSRPMPGLAGLWPGTVQKISADPEKGERIKVHLPGLHKEDKDGMWARLATPDAGNKHGMVFRPEKDDEVLVGFYDNDARFPVVMGQVFSKAHPSPAALEAKDEKNHIKGLVTRSGIQLLFDDDKKTVTLKTPGDNLLEIHDKDKKITLKDQHGNSIVLEKGGITLDSPKDITVQAKGGITLKATKDITLDAKGNVSIKATQNVKAEGLGVEMKGTTAFKAEAPNTTLSGFGLTTIKGGLVKIN